MVDVEQMKLKLQSALSAKRYLHTIGVAESAKKLATLYGEDITKAEIAALLHDCAKDMPDKLKLNLCGQYHIKVNKVMECQPDLTHSFLGAEIAKIEYGVTDEDILNAIRYHTTGRAEMSNLEKIVFLADSIEPNRKPFRSLEEIKKLAFESLDEAVVFSLSETVKYIDKKGLMLHELTLFALEHYSS